MANDPSARNGAVLEMMQRWRTININVGGTNAIRYNAEEIIPREPKEPDDAYKRRIFHAVMPPFIQRLASQAAGTICAVAFISKAVMRRTGTTWAENVTGDGTPLNEFCRGAAGRRTALRAQFGTGRLQQRGSTGDACRRAGHGSQALFGARRRPADPEVGAL